MSNIALSSLSPFLVCGTIGPMTTANAPGHKEEMAARLRGPFFYR